MKLIRDDFKEEIRSAQTFFDSISNVQNIDIRYMMYSSMILILYNIIESTTSKILTRLHDEIIEQHSNGLKYHDFIGSIRTIIYKSNCINQSGKKFNFNKLEDLKIKPFDPTDEYGKFNLNGNVDAKRIKAIFEEYGISEIKCNSCDKLLDLKLDRQKLAHGNQTFTEYGQRTSKEDIQRYLYSAKGTLYNAINNAEIYINKLNFKQNKL